MLRDGMSGEDVLAVIESKLDQLTAAADDLRKTLEEAEKVELDEELQDRLMLLMIKFGRHISQPLKS
jgi:cell division protein FtsX